MNEEIELDRLHPEAAEKRFSADRHNVRATYLGLASLTSSTAGWLAQEAYVPVPRNFEGDMTKFMLESLVYYGPALLGLATLGGAGFEYVRAVSDRIRAGILETQDFEPGKKVSYESIADMVRSLPLLPDQIETLMREVGGGLGIQSDAGDGSIYYLRQGKSSQEWQLEIGSYGEDVDGHEYGYIDSRYVSDLEVESEGDDTIRLRNVEEFGINFRWEELTFVTSNMHKGTTSRRVVHPQDYSDRKDFFDQVETMCVAVSGEQKGIMGAFAEMLVAYRLLKHLDDSQPEKFSQLFHKNFLTLFSADDFYRDNKLGTDDKHRVKEGIRAMLAEIPLSSLVAVAPNILKDVLTEGEKADVRVKLQGAREKMAIDREEWEEHQGDEESYIDSEVRTTIVDGKVTISTHPVVKYRATEYAQECLAHLASLDMQQEAVENLLDVVGQPGGVS